MHYNLSCATYEAKSEWMFHLYLHPNEIPCTFLKLKKKGYLKIQLINKDELLSFRLGVSSLVFLNVF